MIKEGLEKYFEGGQVDPDNLPEVDATVTQDQHAEINVQQEGEAQEEGNAQEQVQEQEQEEVLTEQVQEIGEVQEAPQPVLEVVEDAPSTPDISTLPEGVNKLVEFMNDTGGSLKDYLDLNKDFNSVGDEKVLKDYYTQTKPHLDQEDIDYLVAKQLDISEDLDENEAREKKITLKENLSKAKAHLESNKSRYYEELKASAQKPEVDEKLIAAQQAAATHFKTETDKVFEGFKGFNFSLGEGKPVVRYAVADADKLKETQSDLNNVIGGFLDENGQIKDAQAYHKALFAMQNADKIAQLFYEQGYANAVKEKATDSKNIDFEPQKASPASNTKLKPGQFGEIAGPTKSYGVKLKYNKY